MYLQQLRSHWFISSLCLSLIVSVVGLSSCAEKPPEPPAPKAKVAPPAPPPPTPEDRKAAQALRQSGLAARAGDRYPEAIADLEKAVELDPENLPGHVLLGWTRHLAGQEDGAEAALKQALELDPNHIPALNALGIVYLVAGNLPEAIATHQQALSLKADNEIARYNLSLAFHRLQDYDQAILNAEAATTLEPHNPHPWVALAIAHWDKGDKTAAQGAYQQAIALDARYRDRTFLAHLKDAGFAPAQIQTAQQILENQ